MLFRSQYSRSLDPKGRLMLPPEFREILLARSDSGRLALTTRDGCIYGYPWPDWQETEEKILRIKSPSRVQRDLIRRVLGSVVDMTVDGQGRIRLSRELTSYAGIEKDAVILGNGSRFEIWEPSRLISLMAQNFDDVTLSGADSGIDLAF